MAHIFKDPKKAHNMTEFCFGMKKRRTNWKQVYPSKVNLTEPETYANFI
jgi:hypothetical protein